MATALHDDKLIYQYGNAGSESFVFVKQAFEKTIITSYKTVYTTNAYTNGDIDMLGSQRPRKSEYEIEATFYNLFNSPYSQNYVNRVFNGEKRTVFYYDFVYNPSLDINSKRDFGKVYYNKARTQKPPDQTESRIENIEKASLESTVILKQKPFFYDCSESVEYINYQNYIASLNAWDNNTYEWDTNNDGWDFASGTFGFIDDLSNTQKLEYFTNLHSKLNPLYLMQIRDRFFDRDTTQTKRRYIINETQNSNTQGVYSTTNDLAHCSADTDIYRIELSQMSQNQNIQIINLTNSSGLVITWLDGTSSDTYLVYNSYTKKLYQTANEIEVDEYKYNIDIVSKQPLYFSGLLNPYRIGVLATEQIRLINSTGTNLDIKIDVLPAYD
jgi:hypothetical protein